MSRTDINDSGPFNLIIQRAPSLRQQRSTVCIIHSFKIILYIVVIIVLKIKYESQYGTCIVNSLLTTFLLFMTKRYIL